MRSTLLLGGFFLWQGGSGLFRRRRGRGLRMALDVAEIFVAAMPSDKAGLILLRAGRPVEPDPTMLDATTTHVARRRGHWPSSPDITAAMLAQLQTPKL